MSTLKDTKKNYQNKCEEAEKSQAQYLKAKADSAIRPKDLNKLASKSTQANDRANTADKEYQVALKAANQKQSKYYESEMPKLLDEFQRFEEERETFLKNQFERVCSGLAEFPPYYSTISTSCQTATSAINKDSDTDLFVKQNKTGVNIPPEIPYEPYDKDNSNVSQPGVMVSPVNPTTGVPKVAIVPVNVKPAGLLGAKVQTIKPVGLGPQDDHLSPEEKKEKLEKQLADVKNSIKAETKSKKGLEKLVKFYSSDPSAQDKARGELEDQARKVSQLKENKKIVERQLAELSGGEYPVDDNEDDGEDGNETDEPKHTHHHQPAANHNPASQSTKAKALYDYDATNDNELSFSEGDVLIITEQDDSGWWFAEKNGRTGFIPNNYVEILPY